MRPRHLLFAFAFALFTFAGMPAKAADAIDIPPAVQTLLTHASQSWADRKLDEVMTDFHPNFKSIGRDKDAQRKYYETQVFPFIKRWEHSLSSFKQDGNIARVTLVTRTEMGAMPFPTTLIFDNGRWYFYGNRE